MRTFALILTISIIGILSSSAYACTDFRVRAQDGTVVIARSMEFAMDLESNLRSSPKGKTRKPRGKIGFTWESEYGYVYLDGFDIDVVVDGMNEAGLSFEYLYLPGFTEYESVPPGQTSQALSYLDFGHWVLGNFAAVSEVQNALSSVFVFEEKLSVLGDMVFPLHAAIYDKTGTGIVVEFVEGQMEIHENELGVMTNSPPYDWHITNLRNYVSLRPTNPEPVIVEGITFNAMGMGAAMFGLPGDITPPSRFVKTAILLEVAIEAANATEAVNLAEHIMNNVDIPLGLSRDPENGQVLKELTQWVVFKDLTHGMLYYRTYENMSLHAVSLKKLDFSKNASALKMPIERNPYTLDVTDQFLKSKTR